MNFFYWLLISVKENFLLLNNAIFIDPSFYLYAQKKYFILPFYAGACTF